MFFQDDDNHVPIVGVVLSVVLATLAVIVGVAITANQTTAQSGTASQPGAAMNFASAPNTDEARVEVVIK